VEGSVLTSLSCDPRWSGSVTLDDSVHEELFPRDEGVRFRRLAGQRLSTTSNVRKES
jgi:hypothetical protein